MTARLEHGEQVRLVARLRFTGAPIGWLWPYVLVTLNGMAVDPRTAMRAKNAGAEKGFPDLLILKQTIQGHVGLAIELKRTVRSRLNPEQADKLTLLEMEGWATAVPKGCDAAVAIIHKFYGVGACD